MSVIETGVRDNDVASSNRSNTGIVQLVRADSKPAQELHEINCSRQITAVDTSTVLVKCKERLLETRE